MTPPPPITPAGRVVGSVLVLATAAFIAGVLLSIERGTVGPSIAGLAVLAVSIVICTIIAGLASPRRRP